MVRIALLDDYQNVALTMADWGSLSDATVTSFNDHVEDIDELAERLAEFEIVGLMRERTAFPRALFERLGKLRLIVTTGPWNAAVDLKAARDHGVVVCGTGGTPPGTAELTWGLILALVRHIPEEHQAVRAGAWQSRIGMDLAGKTLGLLGLGRLGGAVAEVGTAFRMDLIAWSENLTAERAAAKGARLVTKDALFAQSDIVSVHLVLSRRTRGLVQREDLARMRPSAYLVNTSRGPIVDEAALIEALRARRIAGAALDVFDREPLPADHAFRTLDNVVTTPHIGYVTRENYKVFYEDTVEDIRAFLAGNPIRVLELPASKR